VTWAVAASFLGRPGKHRASPVVLVVVQYAPPFQRLGSAHAPRSSRYCRHGSGIAWSRSISRTWRPAWSCSGQPYRSGGAGDARGRSPQVAIRRSPAARVAAEARGRGGPAHGRGDPKAEQQDRAGLLLPGQVRGQHLVAAKLAGQRRQVLSGRRRTPAGTTRPGHPWPRCPPRPGAAAGPGSSNLTAACSKRLTASASFSHSRSSPLSSRARPGPGRRRNQFRPVICASRWERSRASCRSARTCGVHPPLVPVLHAEQARHRPGRAGSATGAEPGLRVRTEPAQQAGDFIAVQFSGRHVPCRL